ncbi:unnamed protein product [Mytilus edulis]|uniref:Tyrosinase copper-binding domain-containing protein n=1 Tax=Mytilus edulis TaxID=6550 RepID=A0A8S3UR58_MYTED|nr:unnamed protein product [Mytilus edulis]
MIKGILVIGYILSLFSLCFALVEEIKPPDEFSACLKERLAKNDPTHTTYESLNNFCISSNRNKQTAKIEGQHLNISVETVNWINELLRMSEVDINIHERAKRQATNDTNIPIPPYLQFVFPSQFGTPLYPSFTSNTANQAQQQNTAQQSQSNAQGQQTIVQPASVQQNPQLPVQNNVQNNVQNPQIQAQVPQNTQNQFQNVQVPAQGPQVSFQRPQIPVQNIQSGQGPAVQNLQPGQSPAIQNLQPGQSPAIQNLQAVQNLQPVQNPAIQNLQQGQNPAIQNFQSAQAPNQFAAGTQFRQPQVVRPPVQQVRQPPRRQLRVRKEYRRLTDQERARYHRAILMMKADTSVPPNRYDALGLIHFRMVDNIHHGGAFLAWHRIFITIFENALRQKVPGVTLPYFDSTMDEAMVDETRSIMFSPSFLGNGNGLVTSGPFAYWQTPSGPLIRNTGNPGGSLFSKDEIRSILTRTRISEILEPGASNQFNLENIHGDVHTWIGGQMEPMETSAFDPIFYMHHAFVDYVWEIFRGNQRRNGINPTQDYPQNYGPESHGPMTSTGFGNLVNSFGLSDMFTSEWHSNMYSNNIWWRTAEWTPGPPMAPGGFGGVNGPMLPGFMPNAFAGRKKRAVEKIAKMKAKRQLKVNQTSPLKSPFSSDNECYAPSDSSQNTFAIDEKSDTRKWVFIPIKIVSKRSPESKNFRAFPIYDGVPARDFDIYSPESYPEISSYFEDEVMPQSKRCIQSIGKGKSVGRIHIRSDGLNYRGTYDEYVIVDLRQAFMESMTYIALRNPEKEYSEVLISAYDSCGRKCKAFCRNEEGDTFGFHECAGSIRVTNRAPYGFGKNYGSAVDMSWNIKSKESIPEFKNDSVHVQFFCDHHEY